jgi:hypothetical protein
MAFLIGGANSAADTGYDIENSLSHRGDGGLEWTPASSTNRRTWTISMWIKNPVADTFIWGTNLSGLDYVRAEIMSDMELGFRFYYDNTVKDIHTNAILRDPSAWYHLVWGVDTTQATDTNRVKIYMNGVQFTTAGGGGGFSTENYPVQNTDGEWGHTERHEIGGNGGGAANWPGYTAEVYYIDGTQYAASDFGEFDEDSGIWKPKNAKGNLTFGTLGFFLEYKQSGTGTNSSGLGADTSGEDNHLECQDLASIDQMTDTPTNNFCTMNPLDNYYQGGTFSEGNCKVVTGDAGNTAHSATMGVANGKWYFEAKLSAQSGSGTNAAFVGILGRLAINNTQYVGGMTDAYGIDSRTGKIYHGSDSGTSFGDAYGTGAIISCAFDLDNNKLYFAEDGTWKNSSDPAAGSNGHSITAAASTQDGFYIPAVSDIGSDNQATWEVNFGNPSFAISSGNADANGYGNFEYAVPSGYYALCTKNLAEYG